MTFARLLIAPTLAASTLAYSHRPRPLLCDSSSSSPSITLSSRSSSEPLLDPHQFATGSVLGIATGLIFKRLGKLFFLVLGGSYLLLRALGSSSLPGIGQVKVPWAQAKRFLLNRSGLGDDVRTKVGEVGQSPIVGFLTRDLTFKTSFLATFLIGLVNT